MSLILVIRVFNTLCHIGIKHKSNLYQKFRNFYSIPVRTAFSRAGIELRDHYCKINRAKRCKSKIIQTSEQLKFIQILYFLIVYVDYKNKYARLLRKAEIKILGQMAWFPPSERIHPGGL
jgi:hypothetical protein